VTALSENSSTSTQRTTTIRRALTEALADALEEDSRVVLIGEDLTKWGTGGGIYGVTKGLVNKAGSHRVRDTPISEEAIVSMGVGSAMTGLRPVVEIMYSDFLMLAMDPLVNQAAKAHYMFGNQFAVPMVVRTNGGGASGKAAQHSQSLETLFAHIPGLEVVVPSTPTDAYALLRAAIATDNPTVFLEHKAMYNVRGPLHKSIGELGRGRIARPGTDITVVASQLGLMKALEAAQTLWETDRVDVEIIDPRTLVPLDMGIVEESVQRTGNIVIAHEAVRDFGWGGYIASEVALRCWSSLNSAPRVVASKQMPIPYSPVLEEQVLISAASIVETVRHVLRSTHD